MQQIVFHRLLSVGRLRFALAALVILASTIGIIVLGLDYKSKIKDASMASIDNVQWALSQVDVELLQLIVTLDSAANQPGKLAEVRLRFDILFSRIDSLVSGRLYEIIRKSPKFDESFRPLSAFMRGQSQLMDGPDPVLQQGLPRLSTIARGLQADARTITLNGVQLFAGIKDRERKEVEWVLIRMGVLTLVLVATLVTMLIMLARLYRDNRQRAAENLNTLSQLDSIVRTVLEAVITFDASMRIVDFNPAAVATFGHSRQDARGLDMSTLITEDARSRVLFHPTTLPVGSRQARVRVMARHREGREFPAEASISHTEAGGIPISVLFLRDLSAQVASEQALMQARDDALAGEKAKTDLLVVMSHEIRTPLNGMIGTIELMDSTELLPDQREYLRIMQASGKLLMHHVNDVLDIARLDSGKTPLSLGPVDLSALVLEIFDNQTPASQSNGDRLVLVAPQDGRNRVIGDAAQLRQVLLNLVGNAVKFTQGGTITVELSHLSPQGPTEIRVADTGIGMAPQDLDRIFDDFVTLDASYSRPVSGTGLGLGIVKRIVARMGGTLSVESQRGKGSMFRICLPLHILEVEAKVAAQQPVPAVAGPRGNPSWLILVVEDNAVNRLIVGKMLAKEGHQVVEACDGEAGIRLAGERRFDLILMDISMPGTDGLQATKAIRASGASRDTPIVALTAHAMQAEIDRFRAGGMQQVLIKPITRETLRTTLATVLAGREMPLPDARPPVDRPLLDNSVLRNLAADIGADEARSLVSRFMAETESRIALLVESATDAGPDTSLVREVHQLAGASGMLGALALHQVLSRIETLCKAGAKAEARAELPALGPLWQATAAAYRESDAFAQVSNLR